MNIKKDIIYLELEKAVYYQWDPIGISDCADSIGEYDSYIPALCSFLKKIPPLKRFLTIFGLSRRVR